MSYSSEQRAQAIAGASSVRTARQNVSQVPSPGLQTASPVERPKPTVTFHMEKKVGDATLTVYGSDGQEKEAKEAIDRAAKKFRGGVDSDE